ncbi:MAG TPA: type II toxin-antitoxin system YafQ family toxin [Candidatus Kapabacteria bacterium]
MLSASYSKQFDRDIKRLRKRGKDLAKLKPVLDDIISERMLHERYRDHKLQGPFAGTRECHIEFDWVLIYKLQAEEVIFQRTGTHSDLFE